MRRSRALAYLRNIFVLINRYVDPHRLRAIKEIVNSLVYLEVHIQTMSLVLLRQYASGVMV